MIPENIFQEFYNANFGALIGTLCFIFFFYSILIVVRMLSLNTLTLLLSYVLVYLTSFILLLLVFAIAMGIAVAKVIEMKKLNASNLRYVSCITTNCIRIFYIAHHSTTQHNLKVYYTHNYYTRPFSSLIVFGFLCVVF